MPATRNIQDIAPLLAEHFLDFECDSEILKNNEILVHQNAHLLGKFHNYLGQLHDSWILSTRITPDKFSITLNDFATHVFSKVIAEKKHIEIQPEKLKFPIELEFETISLSFNRVNEAGKIFPIEPTSFNEYLYEQIISAQKEKIEIGLVVWKD